MGYSNKISTRDYRLNLPYKLNSHINDDETFKSRYRNGEEAEATVDRTSATLPHELQGPVTLTKRYGSFSPYFPICN